MSASTPSAPLWTPSPERVASSNLTGFTRHLERAEGVRFSDYEALHAWSVEHPEAFWSAVWDFTQIVSSKRSETILADASMPGASWFPGARLNFAENLLRFDDDRTALVCVDDTGRREALTYAELRTRVQALAGRFEQWGVVAGDRVAALMPNRIEAVVTMLAATSLGAVYSSCSPDFGFNGVMDRFGQIAPKVLVTADGVHYAGKTFSGHDRTARLLERIESIEHVIIVPVVSDDAALDSLRDSVLWDDALMADAPELTFAQLPFDHPLYILYSSGTTGVPKCIVHGAGGTLLQHAKELVLHADLDRSDVLFYFTTCGWMMWNWLVSSLASRASIVLFDGSPMFKSPDLLLKIAQREKITLFGISAKYVDALRKFKPKLKYKFKLNKLRTICSTGSPLSEESFKYVYKHIKKNVHLSSISGGTDIVSCFVLGNLYQPVNIGEIQNNGLALDVDVLSDEGKSLKNIKGELVCKNPFPSMPLKFWNDKNDIKFKSAYFNRFKNIWHHGDYAEIKNSGGYIIHGRSDTTLNPGGVRLGTAEIYSEVEKFKEIKESIVVGQSWDNDVRIVLFIVMSKNYSLNTKLIKKIKLQIKKNASPRHVPGKIIVVNDIPRTKSGKIVELAVKNKIEGNEIKNIEALANPEALEQFNNLKELSN